MEKLSHEFVEKARSFISSAKNIVIISHKNPDGDALGSGLAMLHIFKKLNINATFIVPNQLPAYLKWMPVCEQVVIYENQKERGGEIIQAADLVVMVDFNHRSRLSEMGDKIIPHDVHKIMIDHHPDPENIADLIYSRTTSSSTAEMVYEFFKALFGQQSLNKDAAECLFLGIMTDTGSFSYNCSHPKTFEVVANLLSFDINKDAITNKVYNNYSEGRLRLLGRAIDANLTVLNEFGSAHIKLSKADLESYKFEHGDTEGFVNYPLSIGNIVFSAIFIEKDNYTKCSFRSKGNFPANLVAKEHFGGGGHMNAAGGEYKGSMANAVAKFESVLPLYKKYLHE